ncbi:hypothetical protein [Streptomyces sp. LN590]|uniref:hypothetical protein n=1 Tax=Streptomyces sp. LN590 TaxID=3112980 RepID=UPI00371B3C13
MERLEPLLDGLAGVDVGLLDGLDVVQSRQLLLVDGHETPESAFTLEWCGTSLRMRVT